MNRTSFVRTLSGQASSNRVGVEFGGKRIHSSCSVATPSRPS